MTRAAWLLVLALCACGSPDETVVVEICDNGIDDDEDAQIDCVDADCHGKCPENCVDTIDNDGDALADCADSDCDGQCPELCGDGRDNDGDGSADCDDADCAGLCPEVCGDGVDNDGNGWIDCMDPGCNGQCPEACNDELDNDGDGATDCLDDDCDGQCPETCHDGRDNDGDGAADCDDRDCDGWCPELCEDTWDNDLDGYVDCDDLDCRAVCDADGDWHVAVELGGDDCDDDDPGVHPAAFELCEDGIDQDCDGIDPLCVRESCLAWQNALGSPVSDVYSIQPDPYGPAYDVWCDMDTDGGGWTLVASSAFESPGDEASGWYADLATLDPLSSHSGIWNGLRPLIDDHSDIRFTCKLSGSDPTMAVDLSFYDIHWYLEITEGSDADSCFNEDNGTGYDFPPARRDNLSGALLPEGDDWDAGYLEGEDTCDSTTDFTIDFDDRGMDSSADGTDWGEDDGDDKCGYGVAGEAWFVYVRELG